MYCKTCNALILDKRMYEHSSDNCMLEALGGLPGFNRLTARQNELFRDLIGGDNTIYLDKLSPSAIVELYEELRKAKVMH